MRGEGWGQNVLLVDEGIFVLKSLCLGVLGIAKKILQSKCDGTIKVKNAKKKKTYLYGTKYDYDVRKKIFCMNFYFVY